jgi:hypothetical protein
MKILILDPNTAPTMTEEIAAAARAVAAPGPPNPRTHWTLSNALGLDT